MNIYKASKFGIITSSMTPVIMAYPTVHIIYPDTTVSKRNHSFLHDILVSVYEDGYSYTIQIQEEHIYVFLKRR